MKIYKSSILVLCLLLITHISFAKFPASPALVSMMKQVQKTYLRPQNTNFREISNKHSLVNLAILFGFGMQSQKRLTTGNRHHIATYEALTQDIYILFEWLVNQKKGIDNNGKPISKNDLIKAFTESLNGKLNKFSIQNYNINPIMIKHQSVLNLKTNAYVAPISQSAGHGIRLH